MIEDDGLLSPRGILDSGEIALDLVLPFEGSSGVGGAVDGSDHANTLRSIDPIEVGTELVEGLVLNLTDNSMMNLVNLEGSGENIAVYHLWAGLEIERHTVLLGGGSG